MDVLAAYGQECRPVFDGLLDRFRAAGDRMALFLVYDRPSRAAGRPDLDRTYFVQRCLSDQQLQTIIESLRSCGCYVQLFASEIEFATAAAAGRLDIPGKPLRMVYNGIEGGIGANAFGPGRKALIPALCDAFAIPCANSNAYACAVGRHKFHYSQILRANGLPVPPTWFYQIEHGWMLGQRPPPGERVIVKSTYESWSVGVSDQSVFTVAQDVDERVHAVAAAIGQSVCVQLFRKGDEVCAPILACPEMMAPPLVGTRIARRPGDPEAVMTMEDNLAPDGVRHFPYEGSDEATRRRAANLAGQCARVLGLSGLSRMDMRIHEGEIVIFDIGVSPGVTEKGSSAASFAALGYDHRQFVQLVFAGNLAARGLIQSPP